MKDWKKYHLPDPNSTNPADQAFWRNASTKALSGVTTDITNNVGGGDEFAKGAAKANVDRFSTMRDAGDNSRTSLADIQRLRTLSTAIGNPGQGANVQKLLGPYLTSLKIDSNGLDELQQYNSVLQKLAPQMHVPGTGSQSDIEFKGAVASLGDPSMTQTARAAIIDGLEATHRYNVARSKIANAALSGKITPADASDQLEALPDPLKNFAAYKEAHPEEFPGAAPASGGRGSTAPTWSDPPARPAAPAKALTATEQASQDATIKNAQAYVAKYPGKRDALKKALEAQFQRPIDGF